MENKKKLLLVANVAKEHINKFHIPTIKAFKSNGWVVDVACSGDAIVPECDHQFDMCWKRSPFTYKTFQGIRELKRIINKEQYDIVYCHTPVGGLVTRFASRKARKKGTKVIYCAHGFHFFKGAPLFNWIVFYPMEKILAHLCDCIFTVNEEDYKLARKRFTKKTNILLVPEVGVNFDRLNISDPLEKRKIYRKELGLAPETTALIYVAELLPNKNQKMLVDTLNVLKKQGEDVKLILPGPDHDNGDLQRYIDLLGLTDSVKLLGWRSDIGELLNACDICTASSIREGFGINLVEAMYCGLPVVATDNRGHQMIINDGENGFLVSLNNVELMVIRIQELIHNKDLYDVFATKDVSMYDCNLVANRLFQIITKEN